MLAVRGGESLYNSEGYEAGEYFCTEALIAARRAQSSVDIDFVTDEGESWPGLAAHFAGLVSDRCPGGPDAVAVQSRMDLQHRY